MWYALDGVDSELPILSLLPLHTAVYKKRFPDRPVVPMYSGPDCLLEHAISLSQSMSWAQALQVARDGAAELCVSGADGILFVTPDVQGRIAGLCGRQRVIRYPLGQRSPKLYRFDSLDAELEFLHAQNDAVIFTRNSMLQQLIEWGGGVYMRFAEWRFCYKDLYDTSLVGASFNQILEALCPNKEDLVYRYMSQLAHHPTSQFVKILRDILDALERDVPSFYELLFCDRRIVFCGLDEGDWPHCESPEGALFRALLQTADVIATRNVQGYGKHKLHSWSAYCTSQDAQVSA